MSRLSTVVLVAVLFLLACSTPPSRERLAEGDRLVVEGKMEEALAAYRAVAEEEPGSVEARISIARVEFALGSESEGLEALGLAVLAGSQEERPEVVLQGFGILMESGRPEAALRWIEEHPFEGEADPRLILARGQAQLVLGRIDAAVLSFEEARKVREDARTLALVGQAYLLAGMRELDAAGRDPSAATSGPARERGTNFLSRAKNAIQEALYLDPEDFSAHLYLGQLYHQAGRMEEALLEYRWAQRCNPESPEAYLLLGVIHLDRGKLEEALRELEGARDRGGDVRAAFYLGATYWKLERRREALASFDAVLGSHPELEGQVLDWFETDRDRNLTLLVGLLETGDQAVVASSLSYLKRMTGQDFGVDAGDWRDWLRGPGGTRKGPG